ncbi:MAG: O-antigen ligase family protein [Proteobacteria bacterium]|nr:O-antigen ligase family protein [Pseudomonadota bacterium]
MCVPDIQGGLSYLIDNTVLTFLDNLKRAFPFLLLAVYGIFMCGYFIFQDYSDHYRFFAKFVFIPGLFVFVGGIRNTWRHPVFQAMAAYMFYLLLSGLWSDPLDWYRLGQKTTISIYLLSFIATTHFLVHWNRGLYERMLQLSVLIAAAAALTNVVLFYREHAFPGTRLDGIGSLTNVNEFSNMYGVFALLGVGFARRTQSLPYRVLLSLAIVVFVSFAWFGQSRTAFVSIIIALLASVILMPKERRALYTVILAGLVAVLALIFHDSAEQAFVRGAGLRPQIWAGVWEAAKSTPIVGHGFISEVSVAGGKRVFETVHNAYLQVFWQGGVIGLGLFLLMLAATFHHAWLWGRQRGEFTIFCMFLFVASTMMTGVDTLIERPRDQWMLFWFPLALLLAYQSTTPRSDSIEKSEIQN